MTTVHVEHDELGDIRELAHPLLRPGDFDVLIDHIGDARYVLLGEASHGTLEFYGWRAGLTKRLIAEHGFSFVGVEGDWPDCWRVNRWAKGKAEVDASARDVLGRFERWPTWMWANEEVADFAEWLRRHNAPMAKKVGFYGLDVYSLWDSLRAVLDYLQTHHPDKVDAAVEAFRCFQPYHEDPQEYALATANVLASCADEVVDVLLEVRRLASPSEAADGDPEAVFDAGQNAEVLVDAERYYRAMVRTDSGSWNVRDVHMADTLDRLMEFHGPDARAIVWAHNTHVGDARFTDMAQAGMVNIGQLARERHATDGVVLVGFGGHHGTVIAADFWGAPPRVMNVPAAPAGTHEDLLHRALDGPSLLVFPDDRLLPWLTQWRGHRAIGVVYRPGIEQRGNWVPTVMGGRYDALMSFGLTHALHPLHWDEPEPEGELETYPWSL
jgi:erythromycin esterase-like protein